jgi:hypothetical protein
VRRPVHFNDSERMSVDRKHIVGVTRHIDQPESIPHTPLDRDHSQIGFRATWKPTDTVDQTRIGYPNGSNTSAKK